MICPSFSGMCPTGARASPSCGRASFRPRTHRNMSPCLSRAAGCPSASRYARPSSVGASFPEPDNDRCLGGHQGQVPPPGRFGRASKKQQNRVRLCKSISSRLSLSREAVLKHLVVGVRRRDVQFPRPGRQPLSPNMPMITAFADAGRTVLVLPRRTLLADPAAPLLPLALHLLPMPS